MLCGNACAELVEVDKSKEGKAYYWTMEKARIVSSYLDVYPDVLEGNMLRQACAEPSRSAQHKSLRIRHPRSESTCLHQDFI